MTCPESGSDNKMAIYKFKSDAIRKAEEYLRENVPECICVNEFSLFSADDTDHEDDLKALAKLHKWCRKEDKHYYLMEYIKIVRLLWFNNVIIKSLLNMKKW